MHHHEKLFIDGPAGKLQAIYQAGESGKAVVLVCHPHPQFGGTMRNKVVYWIARAFEDLGHPVLRFNFRGVEQSEGEWDAGLGEADDAAAALEWLHEKHPDVPLWLAGFSFGCYAGLNAAIHDDRVKRIFAIAPAVNLWDFSFVLNDTALQHGTRPLKVIHGTADELVPHDMVTAWVGMLEGVEYCEIDGAGHFFPEHMQQLQSALISNLS
ncbi:MAG: alpha/beta fold hydrolase [Mariprofundaceae bacterium]